MDEGEFDGQVVRPLHGIGDLAKQFVLLRITNMRGLDLDIFDFDFDLTWAALFLNADGHVLGRYGTQGAEPAEQHRSTKGLRYAMTQALDKNRHQPPENLPRKPGKRPEDYPLSQKISPKGCIHCHNINEFRREEKQKTGAWKIDDVFVYPDPRTLGLILDVDQGNKILDVLPSSSAEKLGLKKGAILQTLAGKSVASLADVRHALHQIPAHGPLHLTWVHQDNLHQGTMELPPGWRITDVSWRWSLKSLAPAPGVDGEDLSAEEKRKLGLSPSHLAFRQGAFVTAPARHAGIRINDIILGVDDRTLEMTVRQFETYIRLNYKVGELVHFNVLRGKERLKLPLLLPQ
jgi:serine protease Do